MKIEPSSNYTREIDVPAEEVEQVIAQVNEWLADIDDGDLDSVIEYWVLTSSISETDRDDWQLVASRLLKFHICSLIRRTHAKSSSHVIDDHILRVGMEMQSRLDAERNRVKGMKVTEMQFAKIAKECDYQTHLIQKETGLSRRAVQVRRKKLLERSADTAPKD